jgi:hypothetical protein
MVAPCGHVFGPPGFSPPIPMRKNHNRDLLCHKSIALKQERTVLGEKKKFFYNPMWSRLGDMSEGLAGTYYYNSASPTNYFWHTFDQVLIRPSLLAGFSHDDLKVIDKIGNTSLIKNGKIDKERFSDHLPLVTTLKVSQLNLE